MFAARVLMTLTLGSVLAPATGGQPLKRVADPADPLHRAAPPGARTICSRAYSQSACKRIWGQAGDRGEQARRRRQRRHRIRRQAARRRATPCCLSSNTHVLNVSFFAKLPYDPIKDFEPVTLVATHSFRAQR